MNIYELKNKLAENNFSIVYELISDELRENVTGIAFSHVKKLNDEYDALKIKLKNTCICPQVKIDAFEGGIFDVKKMLEHSIREALGMSFDPETRLALDVVSFNDHKDHLRDIPKRFIGETGLAFILKWIFDENDSGRAISIVTDDFLKNVGLSFDEAFNYAASNTNYNDIFYKDLDSVLSLFIGESSPLMIVTNSKRVYGSAYALNNKNIWKELAAELGGSDLYILPSSTQELLALSSHFVDDAAVLENTVREVNETLEPDILLSNKVYYYSAEYDSITVCSVPGKALA